MLLWLFRRKPAEDLRLTVEALQLEVQSTVEALKLEVQQKSYRINELAEQNRKAMAAVETASKTIADAKETIKQLTAREEPIKRFAEKMLEVFEKMDEAVDCLPDDLKPQLKKEPEGA